MERQYAEMLVKGINEKVYHCTDDAYWTVNIKMEPRFGWPGAHGTDANYDVVTDHPGIAGRLSMVMNGVELSEVLCAVPPYILEDELILTFYCQEIKMAQDIHIKLSGPKMKKDTPLMPEDWYQKGVEYWEKKRAKMAQS